VRLEAARQVRTWGRCVPEGAGSGSSRRPVGRGRVPLEHFGGLWMAHKPQRDLVQRDVTTGAKALPAVAV